MSRNEVIVGVPPARVWEELATAERYADWVVGADRVRWADPEWPAPGASFGHVIGLGPLKFKDTTSVVQGEHLRGLLLDAGVGPLGQARVELTIAESAEGTRVVMEEKLTTFPRLMRRLVDPFLKARNAEALRRLRSVCESAEREEAQA